MTKRRITPSGSYGLVSRYRFSIPVQIPRVGNARYQTSEVSTEGFFIETVDPLPVDELFTVYLFPPGKDSIEALCSIKFAVTKYQATTETPAGMELGILNMERTARDQWEDFVDQVSRNQVTFEEEEPDLEEWYRSGTYRVATDAPEPVSQYFHRTVPTEPYVTQLEVRLRDVKTLLRLIKQEILGGTLSIQSDQPVAEGTTAELSIIHPVSGTTYTLEGRVSEVVADPSGHSATLLIDCSGVSPTHRRNLLGFAITGKIPER